MFSVDIAIIISLIKADNSWDTTAYVILDNLAANHMQPQ